MVERIVAAGRRVLVQDGYDAFSTNRVAAAAGISPGSLYQYFPDKTAILDVVVERYTAELAERVVAALGDRLGDAGPATTRAVVEALLAALEADRELLRVVEEELPPRRLREQRLVLEQRVIQLVTAVLAARDAGGAAPAQVRAWVAVMAIENLAVRWVLDAPPIPRDRLVAEVGAVATRYLEP
jgi:AcrR family transcriptional regulator